VPVYLLAVAAVSNIKVPDPVTSNPFTPPLTLLKSSGVPAASL
jgi:hypothetical protein